MGKLRSIQVLRGVAATAVVVHHAYGSVHGYDTALLGAAGVDLFFVISGFIMVTVAAGKRPGEFLTARIWRIYPLWLTAVLPWLIVGPHSWQTIMTSLTLWPVWNGAFHAPAMLLGWTLCFEMMFYAAFCLGLGTRPIVPLVLFAMCVGVGTHDAAFAFMGSPLILEFLMGAIIAKLPNSGKMAFLIPVALALFAVAPTDFHAQIFGIGAFERVLAWGIPAALLVCGARSVESLAARRFFNAPVFLGEASFSIYLFHRLIVGRVSVPWPVSVILGVLLGVAIYWFFERRIIALKPSWISRGRPDVPPTRNEAGIMSSV